MDEKTTPNIPTLRDKVKLILLWEVIHHVTEELWNRLPAIRHLTFESTTGPGSHTGWQGVAEGTVEVRVDSGKVHFFESCRFVSAEGVAFDFKNRYLWERDGDAILLSHLRRGTPTFLVALVGIGPDRLKEKQGHVCGRDTYALSVRLASGLGFEADWRIRGPKKNEHIRYLYS